MLHFFLYHNSPRRLLLILERSLSLAFYFTNTVLQLVKGLCLARNQWCNALGLLLINDLPKIVLGTVFTFSVLSILDAGSKCEEQREALRSKPIDGLHSFSNIDDVDMYLKSGPGNLERDIERKFSYALSREDLENAILGGP
ncbi:hypothetical protein R1flu_026594 [Riccia fluitans]|uniref:Uncharacterized protein n=1 Tax=Riccia fluitans TaxID=41844 RepID=A0ABD1XJC9_9MARC